MYMYFNTASLNNKLLTDRSRVYSELQWGGGGGEGLNTILFFICINPYSTKALTFHAQETISMKCNPT